MLITRSTVMRWYPLVHLGLYQATWFAALMGGAAMHWWPGLAAGALMLAIHLALSTQRRLTLSRLVQATLLGVLTDLALAATGAVSFAGCACVVPPVWMVVLWPCFASLFDDLLRWVPERPLLAVVLGGIGGPLAYLGGAALGALTFPWGSVAGLFAVAAAWAVATWVLVLIWRSVPRASGPVEVA
ncbi:MAG: DUF2878 domain-containing protein [Planctomycetes bacterium]|jgi:hypothetical protein|nr:DUF2878 domain-containing protein [Planctomycetota bacterium]